MEESKKSNRGRKTTYNKTYHPKIIELLAQLGKINREIAKELGVSGKTLDNWIAKYPELLRAIKRGRAHIDDQVENALLRRALGAEHPEDKVFCNNGQIIVQPVIKHYPPDTAAAFIWLKNRRPDKWRDKHETEINGEVVEILRSIFSKKNKKIEEE